MPLIIGLPSEIMDNICGNLDSHDTLSSIRASCRVLKAAADRHAFRHIKFCMHHEDFDVLRSIVNDYRAEHVQSLTYNTRIMRRYQSYDDDIPYDPYDDELPDIFHLADIHRPPVDEAWIAAMRDVVDSIHRDQVQILAVGEDFDFLREVVPKFPNLREIIVAGDYPDSNRHRNREPNATEPILRIPAYQCLNLDMTGVSHVEGTARHLRAILEAVQATGGSLPRLISIQVGFLSLLATDEDFERSDMPSALPPWPFPPIYPLQNSLSTQLSVLTHFGILLGNERPWIDDPRKYSVVKSPRIKFVHDIIKTMPNLQSLTLGAKYEFAWLYDLIPYDHHWERLHTVHLINMGFGYETMLDLLLRHKQSLRTIILETCCVRGWDDAKRQRIGWDQFIPDLKAGFLPHSLDFTFFHNLREEARGAGDVDPECMPMVRSYFRDKKASKLEPLPRISDERRAVKITLQRPLEILKMTSFFSYEM
ncbi:hypothetical protein QC762_507680 [Podospora pseudocomata]|uniref:F-box domain-containing protein n=1 Tax=Podospora pseudocomata TaxID=2093779 RepID=A0ABR0GCP3_9PEZI|nr:hypothetical protein QC762_507680 [Podospora pseudocomata]